MTFQELAKKFERKNVDMKEFEEIGNSECVWDIEYEKYLDYFKLFKYSVLSYDCEESFIIYSDYIL